MGKVIPTASFRRAAPDPNAMAAFVNLDDAPGDTPVVTPTLALVPDAPPVIVSEQPAPKVVAIAEQPAPQSSDRASDRGRWRRKTVQRTDGRELRKQTFYLDVALSHRLNVACAAQQYDLSEAIGEAITAWLETNGR
ncbi:MAG: hypothetical protein ACHREM_01480 [Polyangiales bacterium]